jgi:hypothetical protein
MRHPRPADLRGRGRLASGLPVRCLLAGRVLGGRARTRPRSGAGRGGQPGHAKAADNQREHHRSRRARPPPGAPAHRLPPSRKSDTREHSPESTQENHPRYPKQDELGMNRHVPDRCHAGHHLAGSPCGHNGQIGQPGARLACQVGLERQFYLAIGAAEAGATGGVATGRAGRVTGRGVATGRGGTRRAHGRGRCSPVPEG